MLFFPQIQGECDRQPHDIRHAPPQPRIHVLQRRYDPGQRDTHRHNVQQVCHHSAAESWVPAVTVSVQPVYESGWKYHFEYRTNLAYFIQSQNVVQKM